MAEALCCIAAAEFEGLVSNLQSTGYDCQMRWDGGMTEEAEEVLEVLATDPGYCNIGKKVSIAFVSRWECFNFWWPSCGETIGAELTQIRRMVVDLVAVVQLQNCHAVEEGRWVALASAHSGWDSSLLMEMKRGRCLRRRTLLPCAHAVTRDGCRKLGCDGRRGRWKWVGSICEAVSRRHHCSQHGMKRVL